MKHIPVLLNESIDGLAIQSGDIVFDGTLGGGGHTKEIVNRFGSSVKIIGVDLDQDAIGRAEKALNDFDHDTVFVVESFHNAQIVLDDLNIPSIDKVLLDLGLSSFQIDISERGFSFLRDEPLLMIMKKYPKEGDISAMDVVNDWEETTLANIIYGFGEERYSRRIAKAIVEARVNKKIETTKDLREIIEDAVGRFYKKSKIHPATRTFQAIRIAVNRELEVLEVGLDVLWHKLNEGGKMAVISFHSLEDRIVKNFFRNQVKEKRGVLINKKPVVPKNQEILENPRARSAKLRIIQKL